MSVDDSVEVLAPSIDEAIIVGLTRMVATREEVEIEVLDEGSRGFLGIGARDARVRLTRRQKQAPTAPKVEPVSAPLPESVVEPERKPAPTVSVVPQAVKEAPPAEVAAPPERAEAVGVVKQPAQATSAVAASRPALAATTAGRAADGLDREGLAEIALSTMAQMLPELEITTTVEWVDEDRPTMWVSLEGKDADAMVGPRARNLHAVQYLFRALIYRQYDGDYNVVVDADGYRKRRRRSLESMAQAKAEQAVAEGQTVRLRAMPPHERRIVHMALRGDDRVSTASVGKGRDRAVTIVPIQK
jgi:spoIIIJ-associated protein